MLLRKVLNIFRPNSHVQARLYKQRFAVAYAVLGWNVCGLIFYMLYNEGLPTDKEERKAVLLQCLDHGQDVHKIQLSGMTRVDRKVVRSDEDTVSQVPAN